MDRDEQCEQLTKEAIDWIKRRLAGTHGTGYRGTADLENAIYGWLSDHADFEPH